MCPVLYVKIFFLSLQGWYIVTYALGIYLLNLFIAFLTPKIDPALQDIDGKENEIFNYQIDYWFLHLVDGDLSN